MPPSPPSEISPTRRAELLSAVANGTLTVSAACASTKISDRTFHRWQHASNARRLCTPLAPRLACVRAVQSGQISIRAACQQRNISTRTYYRWLAQKDRLVQLTAGPGAVDDAADVDFFGDDVVEGGVDAACGTSVPAATSAQVDVADLPPEKRAVTRLREQQPAQQPSEADAAENPALMEVDEPDDEKVGHERQPLPSENLSNGSEQKAEKKEEPITSVEADAVPATAAALPTSPATSQPINTAGHNPPTPGATSSAAPSRPGCMPGSGGAGGVDKEAPVDEAEDPPDKHRIVVFNGSTRVSLVWYEGARTSDIKSALARRFHLAAGAFFTLRDVDGCEVNVSQGLPSGTYDLLLI